MNRRLGLAWLGGALLATATIACGDDADNGTGGGGGAGPTSSSNGSTSAESSTGTDGSGGAPPVCEFDQPRPLTFTILNDTPNRLWFAGSGFGRPRLAGLTVDGNGESSCPCDDLESCSGAQATVSTDIGYLDPGQEFVEEWEGLFYFDDPACTEELSCEKGRLAGEGNHTARVTAYLGAPFCDAACDCDLAAGEMCNFGDGVEIPTDPIEASGSFDLPVVNDNQLVIGFHQD